MVGAAGSNQTPKVRTTATALSYNASTSALTATTFVGALSGNASTATALTSGDKSITGSLTVDGNLTINGTTTTLNARELTIDDKNIELGSVVIKTGLQATLETGTNLVTLTTGNTSGVISGQVLNRTSGIGDFGNSGTSDIILVGDIISSTSFTVVDMGGAAFNHAFAGAITFSIEGASDFSANGGGITLKGTTDKTILWNINNGTWDFSHAASIPSGIFSGNIQVGGSILSSNSLSTGTLSLNFGVSSSDELFSTIRATSSGAKTSSFASNIISATTTSSTSSIIKTGLRLESTGTWNGAGAVNRALFIIATGGTTNKAIVVDSGDTDLKNLTVDGTMLLGTEAGKATLQYTTNQARTYTIPDAGTTANFVMTAGAQTINGAKTFNDLRIGSTANLALVTTTNGTVTTRTLFNNTGTPAALSTSSTSLVTEQTIAKGLVTVNNAAQNNNTGNAIYAPNSAGTHGQLLRSSGGTTAPIFEYMGQALTSDSSRIGTTAYTTDLSYDLQANASYQIIFNGGWYRSGGITCTMNFTVNFNSTSGSPRLVGSGFYATSENATSFTNFYLNHSSATDAAAGTGFATANEVTNRQNIRIWFNGYIRVGGTAVTIRVRTNNSVSTSPAQVGLKAGSGLIVTRLA
jgi:hypothetical protein